MTSFFANYGFYSRAELESDPGRIFKIPDLSEEVSILSRFDDFLRYEILYAQDIYKDFADRKQTPAPVFKAGE